MHREITVSQPFSLELILLMLLTGVYFSMRSFIPLPQVIPHARGIATLVVALLGIYVLLDFFEFGEGRRPPLQAIRTILILLVIFVVTFIPIGLAMWMRATTEPYRFVHDGLIQSEAAVSFLLEGKNPYIADYRETPLAEWPYAEGDLTVHPAFSHYPYLPLTFLLPLPAQWLAEVTIGWFDQRVVLLLFFSGTLWLIWGLVKNPSNKRLLLIIFGLNPLLVIFLIEGRNDILCLFWILATVRLLQTRRIGWSALTLGLACATKQFAWFLVPFYIALLVGNTDQRWISILHGLKKPLVIFITTVGSLIIPWLLWDASAFFEDVFAYPSGNMKGVYPIGGFSAGSLLVSLGLIPPDAKFPFVSLQIFFGLFLLILLIVRMRSRMNLQSMLAGYGLWLFVLLFTARSFADNYLGFVVSIMVAAAFYEREARENEIRSPARDADLRMSSSRKPWLSQEQPGQGSKPLHQEPEPTRPCTDRLEPAQPKD